MGSYPDLSPLKLIWPYTVLSPTTMYGPAIDFSSLRSETICSEHWIATARQGLN